jgi:hypothetical protein
MAVTRRLALVTGASPPHASLSSIFRALSPTPFAFR